jgi:hypothetical protein
MGFLKAILREGFGLFVDDGSFALAIVAWIGLMKTLLPRIAFVNRWQGIILFAGLALILVESATRFSGRRGMRNTVK